MPWTVSDVDKHKKGLSKSHKKGLSKSQKQKWVRIANSILEECRETSNDSSCDAQAIRIANSKVGSKTKDSG